MKYTKHLIVVNVVIVLLLAFGGHFIVGPINEIDYKYTFNEILTKHEICNYNLQGVFLIPVDSAKYLTGVSTINWKIVNENEIQKYLTTNKLEYAYFGKVSVNNKSGYSQIIISNWPRSIPESKWLFLSGGTQYYKIKKRFPSLLSFIFDRYEISLEEQIVS